MMLAAPPLDFIVMAYPRSGTTWLANFLTTDRSLCLHDPFSNGLPETWAYDGRKRGISCTVSPLLPGWVQRYSCPIAVIHRDREECDASLLANGLAGFDSDYSFIRSKNAMHVEFNTLWEESGARKLWAHLLPLFRFDELRYNSLRDMHVQPHERKLIPNLSTMNALIETGEIRLGS